MATAITPIAFFETVMVKSYETLVDSNTKVDVNTGIVAAGRLQSLIDSRDYSRDLLVMKVQLDQICDAVKSTVPQEMWGEIIEKLEEAEQHQEALSVGADSFDDADDEPFDPTEFIDDGRRVLTSAAPAVTEGDGDRCRCGRGGRETPAATAEELCGSRSAWWRDRPQVATPRQGRWLVPNLLHLHGVAEVSRATVAAEYSLAAGCCQPSSLGWFTPRLL